MSYETKGKDSRGTIVTFSLKDDDPGYAEYLEVITPNLDENVRIRFDMFVQRRYQEALTDGFSEYGWTPPESFLWNLGVRGNAVPRPKSFGFSSEDASFAKRLEEFGLEAPIATRVAFYTQDFSEGEAAEDRDELFTHFKESNFPVRLSNFGVFQGFTTLDIYLFICQRSNSSIADFILKECRSLPDLMAERVNSLLILLDCGISVNTFSLGQLGALSTVVNLNFPPPHQEKEKRETVIRAVASFLSGDHDFKEAGRTLRRRSELKGRLSNELMRLVDFLPDDTGRQRNLGDSHTEVLASILIATYGEELLSRALDAFATQEHILDLSSSHSFSAFLAFVYHLASGGDENTPIHFVLSLEPDIDSSIIQRGEGELEEDS